MDNDMIISNNFYKSKTQKASETHIFFRCGYFWNSKCSVFNKLYHFYGNHLL